MNIKKLYFWLVSLISIIAIAVSLGIMLSSLWKVFFISNEEYLVTHDYEFKNCEYAAKSQLCWWKTINCNLDQEKYETAVKKCKDNKKKDIILRRFYNLKITLIGSVSTFIVFLIIFLFHYPKFKKEN